MYLREVTSKRKHGPDAVYLQLCTSDWDPERGQARTRIVHSFGRKEEVDPDELRRLVEQCMAYLPAEERRVHTSNPNHWLRLERRPQIWRPLLRAGPSTARSLEELWGPPDHSGHGLRVWDLDRLREQGRARRPR